MCSGKKCVACDHKLLVDLGSGASCSGLLPTCKVQTDVDVGCGAYQAKREFCERPSHLLNCAHCWNSILLVKRATVIGLL